MTQLFPPTQINRPLYHWDKVRLVLHFAFALTIILQMLSSLVMHRPYLGRQLTFIQSAAFMFHSYSGLLTSFLIGIYWYWIISHSPSTLKHLFPCLSKEGIESLWQDFKLLFHCKIPNPQFAGGLPGFIQGLGLLLVSFLAWCGILLFFALPNTQQIPDWVREIKELHSWAGSLAWWYLGGHAGMALLHWLIGLLRATVLRTQKLD